MAGHDKALAVHILIENEGIQENRVNLALEFLPLLDAGFLVHVAFELEQLRFHQNPFGADRLHVEGQTGQFVDWLSGSGSGLGFGEVKEFSGFWLFRNCWSDSLTASSRDRLGGWMRFFAAKTEGDFMELARKAPAMAEAWGVIKRLSADESARMIAEARGKGLRDYAAFRETGRDEEREEGRLEGKLEIARNLPRERLPV
jgi:hypothetical protein